MKPVLSTGNLRKNIFLISPNISLFEYISSKPHGYAEITRIEDYFLIAQRYLRKDGSSRIHIVKDCPKYNNCSKMNIISGLINVFIS